MKKFIYFAAAAVFLFLNMSGCVPILLGGAGALGGRAISRDTIKGNSDKSYKTIWKSSLRVARIKGKITKENQESGEIEFEVKPSRVWITLTKLTDSATEIKVKARKYSLPNLELAEEVFVKIMEDMK